MTRQARPLCPLRSSLHALLLLMALTAPASAQELPDRLPPQLAPWTPWVLERHPDLYCPVLDGEAACIWPGEFKLDARATGGSFSLAVQVDRKMAVTLPGGEGAWPELLKIDGKPAPVIARDDAPSVMLARGEHLLTGVYVWPGMPENIAVPTDIGRIDLSVDGRPVAWPEYQDGTLRLGEGAAKEREENRLELDVSRRITDSIPLRVTTRVAIRAAGSGREVNLGQVLVAHTRPIAIEANLPARFTADGALVVQVRPGSFNVTLEALYDGPVKTLIAPTVAAPWPTQEYWAVETQDRLRAVTLAGPPGIDPARTSLPTEWRSLPTYVLQPGGELSFTEVRRGEPEPAPNRLTLQRELWLDTDGGGLTLRDCIGGAMNQAWRLEISPPASLGHVVDHGIDQVITRAGKDGAEGVEVRRADVNLIAESRIEGWDGALKAVGWRSDVNSLSASINLPPGWSLFAVRGVDAPTASVVDRWSLFDLFFVLVLSLAASRLMGVPWGLLTLAALAISRHQPDAPEWAWAGLLVIAALLKVVTTGRPNTVLRVARAGLLLVVFALMLPFAIDQVRQGLVPALARPYQTALSSSGYSENVQAQMESMGGGRFDEAPQAAAPPPAPEPAAAPAGAAGPDSADGQPQGEVANERLVKRKAPAKMARGRADLDSVGLLGILGSSSYSGNLYQKTENQYLSLQQDPTAVVQTGPGLPRWHWSTYNLTWNGAVTADHTVSIWLISPAAQLVINLLRVVLLTVLALRLAGLRSWKLPLPPGSGTAGLLTLLVASIAPGTVRADDSPAPEGDSGFIRLLNELEQRLTKAPDCGAECISVPSTRIEVKGDRLTLLVEVDAEASGSWPVPGPASVWVPASVNVDGRVARAMARRDDGFLHVRLDPGVHRITVEGPLPPTDALTLQLGMTPQRASASGEGWEVDGIHDDGTVEASIQITRTMPTQKGGEARSSENLAPWLEVHRSLDLGIPWRVQTEVRRIDPGNGPVAVKIPLLPGEAITDRGFQVKDGAVAVSVTSRDAVNTVRWTSTLSQTEKLELKAPTGVPWNEVWSVSCSPVYHCAFSGIAPIRHTASETGTIPTAGYGSWWPEWQPLAGEVVNISVQRPEAVKGQTITIEQSSLDYTPGHRLAEATLTLVMRSSQGGSQTITLPEGARLQQVLVNSVAQPVQARGTKVAVPLQPGGQTVVLSWQQPLELGLVHRVPGIDLGTKAVNASVTVHPPREQWILLLFGPPWGPAPLFWSLIIVVLALAPLLSKLPFAPLKTRQWALLGLGTVVLEPMSAALVGLWFIAMGYRASQTPQPGRWRFNAVQLFLALLTFTAMSALYAAVQHGLLGGAPANIQGNGSSANLLNWFDDRIAGTMPQPTIVWVPMWVWRVMMLLWSLWLAASLVRWLPWAWRAFTAGGGWRKKGWGVEATVEEAAAPGSSVEAPPPLLPDPE